jgi:hypothetical protein
LVAVLVLVAVDMMSEGRRRNSIDADFIHSNTMLEATTNQSWTNRNRIRSTSSATAMMFNANRSSFKSNNTSETIESTRTTSQQKDELDSLDWLNDASGDTNDTTEAAGQPDAEKDDEVFADFSCAHVHQRSAS